MQESHQSAEELEREVAASSFRLKRSGSQFPGRVADGHSFVYVPHNL
jgi:hypothetical protein